MATWGSDPSVIDPKEFPRMKRPGQEVRFRILAIDCGQDIYYHYVVDPQSRSGRGMPVPCLQSCGGTVQQCASTPTPNGKMLHECQEGKYPARRRRNLVWNYDVMNEQTHTQGRPQILEVGGLAQGEGYQIYELIQDPERGDPRFYDLRRICMEVSNNPLYKTRPAIKDIRNQTVEKPYVHTQVLKGTSDDEDVVETKEDARKFFLEFLKRRNKENRFLSNDREEAKKQVRILLQQWEECWDIIHTPPNTVEGVLAMLKDAAGRTPVPRTDIPANTSEIDDIFGGDEKKEEGKVVDAADLDAEVFGDDIGEDEKAFAASSADDDKPKKEADDADDVFDAAEL